MISVKKVYYSDEVGFCIIFSDDEPAGVDIEVGDSPEKVVEALELFVLQVKAIADSD